MVLPESRARLESRIYGSTVARIPREALEGLRFRCPAPADAAIDDADALLRSSRRSCSRERR